jgi:hypothetical protein
MRCPQVNRYLFTDVKNSQGGIEQPRCEDAKLFRSAGIRHAFLFIHQERAAVLFLLVSRHCSVFYFSVLARM